MVNWIGIGIMIALIWGIVGTASAEICVIVNKENPVHNLSISRLAQIYKGEVSLWPDGKQIVTVEMADTHPLAEEFTRKVLHMNLEMKQKMWVTKILSGQAAPPIHLKDEKEVLSLVTSEPGAIGYVKKESAGDAVKCIDVEGRSGL